MKIYTQVPAKDDAISYYRLKTKLRALQELGYSDQLILDDGQASHEVRTLALRSSDIAVFYQPTNPGLLRNMMELKNLGAGKGEFGEWRWPASFVVDTDDNMFACSPFNAAFRVMGWQYGGQVLQPGCEVRYRADDGSDRLLWTDGEGGFHVEENRKRIEMFRAMVETADGATCSTPRCREYVLSETNQRSVFVTPNGVNQEDYASLGGVSVVKKNPKEVRLLWQGGSAHYDDIEPMRGAIANVARKYPHVKWVFWGFVFPWVYSSIPSDRFEFIPWMSHEAYRQRLPYVGHDIALCFLRDSDFNLAKSAIKFYESSICPQAPATLAQNVGPYGDEILDRQTGLLFNDPMDFQERLSELVEDATLRQELGQNARQWVLENRDSHKLAKPLAEFYQELREKRRKAAPPPSEETYARFLKEWDDAHNGVAVG